jgi:hypothetical protein
MSRAKEGADNRVSDAAQEGAQPDVRLSVNLKPDVAGALKSYAGRKGISITEALRRAIVILTFVVDAQDRGASLNVEENGSIKEVLFLA